MFRLRRRVSRVFGIKIGRNCGEDVYIQVKQELKIEISLQSYLQMSFKKVSRNFFSDFDMFKAQPILRLGEQPFVTNFCTGIFSFALFGFFVYVFINGIVDMLNNNTITSVLTESTLKPDEPKAEDIFFAVNIALMEIQEMDKYFEFSVGVREIGSETEWDIPLVPCTVEHFAALQQNAAPYYQKASLSSFYCPMERQYLDLRQTQLLKSAQYILLRIGLCEQTPDNQCLPQAQVQHYLQDQTTKTGSLDVFVMYLDQSLLPTSPNPLGYSLNTEISFSFTLSQAIYASLYIGSYSVVTDVSVLPFQRKQTVTGNYMAWSTSSLFQRNLMQYNQSIGEIYFFMSPRVKILERKIGKFDEMISYAGGLFSLIITFLGWFVMSYNQYLYELIVARAMFAYDDTGRSVKPQQLSFFMYLVYSAYDWVDTLFCMEMKWALSMQIHHTRKEVNKQMDVTRLFRKIENIETALEHVMNRHQKAFVSLVQPKSIAEMEKNRLVLEYHRHVNKQKSTICLQDLKQDRRDFKNYGQSSRVSNSNDPFHMSFEPAISVSELNTGQKQPGSDFEQLYKYAEEQFKDLKKSAEQFRVGEEYSQVEKQLAEHFTQLSEEYLNTMGLKIPLKILFRLKHLTKKPSELLSIIS